MKMQIEKELPYKKDPDKEIIDFIVEAYEKGEKYISFDNDEANISNYKFRSKVTSYATRAERLLKDRLGPWEGGNRFATTQREGKTYVLIMVNGATK